MRSPLKYIVWSLILITGWSSCDNSDKDIQASVEFGSIPPALMDSLKSIGQSIQEIEIDPGKDNVIKGKNGTIIYVPGNSLVDETGKPLSSNVVIELKENYSFADYITSNLQTVHNDDILQTQGMIYLSAKQSDGGLVKIDETKPLRIEFAVQEKIDDAKIFTGKRDENGNLNWSEIIEPSKYLIAYPIRFISKNRFPTECDDFYGITTDTIRHKYYNAYGNLARYENTYLATREFKERYDVACWPEVVKIYLSNVDKNLWEVDELVVKHFIEDSTKRVNHKINWKPPGINGGRRTKEQDEAHEWLVNSAKESGHWRIKTFKKFANQRLTTIDPTKRIADTTVAELEKAFVAYDALEFGWVNVDFFYKDPASVNMKLIAKTNEDAPIINLIIPRRNIILSGIKHNNNTYLFTKNEDGYNKLPKGEKAYIIAISIVDDRLHFGEKEIMLGHQETETVELMPTSAEKMRTRLKAYENK